MARLQNHVQLPLEFRHLSRLRSLLLTLSDCTFHESVCNRVSFGFDSHRRFSSLSAHALYRGDWSWWLILKFVHSLSENRHLTRQNILLAHLDKTWLETAQGNCPLRSHGQIGRRSYRRLTGLGDLNDLRRHREPFFLSSGHRLSSKRAGHAFDTAFVEGSPLCLVIHAGVQFKTGWAQNWVVVRTRALDALLTLERGDRGRQTIMEHKSIRHFLKSRSNHRRTSAASPPHGTCLEELSVYVYFTIAVVHALANVEDLDWPRR